MTFAGYPHDPSGSVAVLVALGIDRALGEPPARLHPVVWFGRALGALRAPWADRSPRVAFALGATAWLTGAVVCVIGALALERIVNLVGDLGMAVVLIRGIALGVLLTPLLSWQLLHDEVAAVEHCLAEGVEAGRARLRYLVSRDTSKLSATVVRESALESLAENLNDSVVAALFWFAIAGLPGAALYRFANTADAMWGYRGAFEWAGKWSARADDVLSYVPARITAALLAVSAWRWPKGLLREARATPSPNGGWPMATLALALDVRLSKPGYYVLHPAGRLATAADTSRALAIAARAAWGSGALAAAAFLA